MLPHTFIANPAEDRPMARTLERPRSPKKTETAKLALANGGEMTELYHIGLTMLGAGLTAATFGALEGMSRAGKAKWWRELSPTQKAMILVIYTVVAGGVARKMRKDGNIKGACAIEAAAIAAYTLAIAVMVEAGLGKEKGALGALGKDYEDMSAHELAQLEDNIDDDIRRATAKLRRLAEEGKLEVLDQDDDGDVGELALAHEPVFDDDDLGI